MFKHPLFTKIAALAAIALLLLFGLGLIEDVVRDRQRYRNLTAQSVADSLAGPQTLMGPLIHSACVESWDVETGKGDERRMVEKRREFLANGFESGAFLKNPNSQGQPPANPLSDPSAMDGMMGMMKNNMAMIIPNTLIMSWINAFFSGYVISAMSPPSLFHCTCGSRFANISTP